MPLRNLKNPVIVVSLSDGSAVIVGQIFATVCVAGDGAETADILLKGSHIRIEADVELLLSAGACQIRLDGRGRS